MKQNSFLAVTLLLSGPPISLKWSCAFEFWLPFDPTGSTRPPDGTDGTTTMPTTQRTSVSPGEDTTISEDMKTALLCQERISDSDYNWTHSDLNMTICQEYISLLDEMTAEGNRDEGVVTSWPFWWGLYAYSTPAPWVTGTPFHTLGLLEAPFLGTPFEQHHGVADFVDLMLAAYHALCGMRCNGEYRERTLCPGCSGCSCLDTCTLTGNCCPDKILKNHTSLDTNVADTSILLNDSSSADTLTDGSTSSIVPKTVPKSFELTHCHNNIIHNNPEAEPGWVELSFRVIDKCPDGYKNMAVRQKCESGRSNPKLFDNVPFHASHVSSDLDYINIHCATCNGDENAYVWNLLYKCKNGTKLFTPMSFHDLKALKSREQKKLLEACHIVAVPPNLYLSEFCVDVFQDELVKTCDPMNLWHLSDPRVARACQEFPTQPVFGRTKAVYKNVFCRTCNDPMTWSDVLKCPDDYKFADVVDLVMERKKILPSVSDEFLDPMTCSPRPVICEEMRKLKGDRCVLETYTDGIIPIQVSVAVSSVAPTEKTDEFRQAVKSYVGNVIRDFKNLDSQGSADVVTTDKIHNLYSKTCDNWAVISNIYLLYLNTMNVTILQDLEPDLAEFASKSYIFEHTYGTGRIRFLLPSNIVNGGIMPPEQIPSEPVEKCADPSHPSQDSAWNIVENLFSTPTELDARILYDPDSFYLTASHIDICKQVILTEDDVDYDYKSGKLTIFPGSRNSYKFNQDSFLVDFSQIPYVFTICADSIPYSFVHRDSLCYGKGSLSDLPEELHIVITWISSGLLLVTAFIYSYIPSLRADSGGLFISLSLNQFLAQVLLLISDTTGLEGWSCRVLGAAVQFFWLSSFCWKQINIIVLAIKIFKPLQAKYLFYPASRLLVLTSLYSYGLPLLIMFVCLTVRILVYDSEGYNTNGFCYLSSQADRFACMNVPLNAIVVINIIISVICLCYIRNRPNLSENTTKRMHQIQIRGLLKLSLLSGIPWAISMVFMFTESEVIFYIFQILVGFQGIYTFTLSVIADKPARTAVKRVLNGRSASREKSMQKSSKDSI